MLNFDKTIYSDLTYLGCAESYLDEILDNVEQIQLFNTFNTHELKVLSQYLNCYAAPRGYQLYSQEAASDHLIILLSGEVSLIDETSDEVHSTYSVGAALGAASLVKNQLWDTTCVTNKPSDIALLSRSALDQILVHNPRLGNKLLLALMQLITSEIKQTNSTHDSAEEALAH